MDVVDHVLETIWGVQSSFSHDLLNNTLPLDESILEVIYGPNRPWDNLDHCSYFLLEILKIEHDEFRSTWSEMIGHAMVPLYTHGICVEGNMVNIYPTITVDISQILGKFENVYIGADFFPEEIQMYTDLFK